ncbi:MAG: M16 family metallopeptidase [Bacteroidia bacterium]
MNLSSRFACGYLNFSISLFILLSLLAQTTLAQNSISFEQYTLPNGLKVILHEDRQTPIVAVTVSYHVGSKDEDPTRTGFAHFFEHLLFEGSQNIARGEYMKLVKENGGVLNANTFKDRTFYFEILPSNQLELALWMESERMLHAKIDDKGIETQREVVKEERRQRLENTPYGGLLDETMSRTFSRHPYRRSVIGSMEHLNAAKKEEFYAFYKKFYVPDNAILSIAGDINSKQTKAWIERYFGGIPRGATPIKRIMVKEPIQKKEVRDQVYDNIQLPAVIHSFKTPALGAPEYHAVNLLATLLSEGESSRFQKSIVNSQQKALFVGAYPIAMKEAGVSLMFGIVNMGVEPNQLEESMEREYDRVRTELITQEEYDKLINQVENTFVNSLATVEGIAETLSDYWMYQGDPGMVNKEMDLYRKVTREDIREAARKYLVPSNRTSLYYLPKPKS